MKLNFTFRQIDKMPDLQNYCQDKVLRLEKYELKMSWANVVISKQRHVIEVELKLAGNNARMVAKAKSDDAYEAMDKALKKLEKQMAKHKDIMQKHKLTERTKDYALDHFTSGSLQVDYSQAVKKKSA